MTTYTQFCAGAKMRHDFGDMIQVRYPHPQGEKLETWVSGEEVMARLKTLSREALIRSFSRMRWQEARTAVEREWQEGKVNTYEELRRQGGDLFAEHFGGHIFGETMAGSIRGNEPEDEAGDPDKKIWQSRLYDPAFRAICLELAWSNLEGTFPEEAEPAEPDDWV